MKFVLCFATLLLLANCTGPVSFDKGTFDAQPVTGGKYKVHLENYKRGK